MICKFNVTFFLFFFLNIGFSQNTTIQKVVNQYVNYVNHCNTYISASHYSVKDYNLKLLQSFKKPDYFYPKKDFFTLECQPGSIECTKKLDTKKIKTEHELLQKNISNLDASTQNTLSKSLQEFEEIFRRLVVQVEKFEEKKFDKEYFLDLSNVKSMEEELQVYKNLITQLDSEFQKVSKVCSNLFNESPLPSPLERTKNMTLQIKNIIQNFNTKNPNQTTIELQKLQKIINNGDLGSELEKMQTFGDFSYTDNKQTQQRANIERYTEGIVKRANQLIENCNCETSFKFGVRTYEKVLNPELHQKVFKIESLSISFNDDTGKSVVKNYNKYIERANRPVLKMIGIVLPFEIIQIEMPVIVEEIIEEEIVLDSIPPPDSTDSKPSFSKENIKTLEGAKTNNLVLLLDVSSSMRKGEKMTNLKTAISYLIDLLRPEDLLTVIIYSDHTKILFSPETGKYSKEELKEKINSLKPRGGTNIKNALDEAYQYCENTFIQNGNNKIIIATDGFFDLNKKGKKLIKNNKIRLSTFHFKSKGTHKNEEEVLKKMAKLGNGFYTVINAEEGAIKSLIQEAKEQ